MMKYQCTLIAVRDMACSKRFYCELLGMEITADFGANVTLSERVALQTLDTWQSFLDKKPEEIKLGNNAAELYFEETDMDGFVQTLAAWPGVKYVHLLKEHTWGQRVVRFYDPDLHIVEVGEALSIVARRFQNGGMTPEQVAQRMDVPMECVNFWLI